MARGVNGSRAGLYWELARPFTLIAPALGMFTGSVIALGASPPIPLTPWIAAKIALGTLMAAVLNAASNTLNQVTDLEADRINKPSRPIPSGRVAPYEAIRLAGWLYAAAFVLASLVGPQCTLLAGTAAVLTVMYSAPPFRLKAVPFLANAVIALPRGVLLKVAGWSCVRDFGRTEPWYIGLIFGLFLLGATTTKDFADIRGDRAAGYRTLPVLLGPRRAAWFTAPFLVLPFLLIPYGLIQSYLTGDPWILLGLTAVLVSWGAYVAYLMLRRPDDLARTENHPSWTHMYVMMFVAQIGFALAYVVHAAR
ncbi:MAG TPA: UbiA family prenyltransferase [Candidatus Limnocylindrales bacterium]|nr:UbiA family prenyltransferase [Candidatus Limnocylindrales bacterium]